MKNKAFRMLMSLACLIALAMFLTPKAGLAQGTYTCTIDTAGGTTCDGWNVVVSNTGGNTRTAAVNLTGNFLWNYMVVRVYTCNPSGWSFHIGDSSTNNGGGGDGYTTQHDAELQVYDSTVTVYGSEFANFSPLTASGPPASGCSIQEYRLFNHYVYVGSAAWLSYFFDFPPYDEADQEDTGYCDSNYSYHCEERKLYIGLNRTYGDAFRNGSGVTQACVFLSSAANTPISGCPF